MDTYTTVQFPERDFFWEKSIFSQLDFRKITGFYSNLGKEWEVIFLLCENIGQKIENILSVVHLSQIDLYLGHDFLTLGSYWKPSLVKLRD